MNPDMMHNDDAYMNALGRGKPEEFIHIDENPNVNAWENFNKVRASQCVTEHRANEIARYLVEKIYYDRGYDVCWEHWCAYKGELNITEDGLIHICGPVTPKPISRADRGIAGSMVHSLFDKGVGMTPDKFRNFAKQQLKDNVMKEMENQTTETIVEQERDIRLWRTEIVCPRCQPEPGTGPIVWRGMIGYVKDLATTPHLYVDYLCGSCNTTVSISDIKLRDVSEGHHPKTLMHLESQPWHGVLLDHKLGSTISPLIGNTLVLFDPEDGKFAPSKIRYSEPGIYGSPDITKVVSYVKGTLLRIIEPNTDMDMLGQYLYNVKDDEYKAGTIVSIIDYQKTHGSLASRIDEFFKRFPNATMAECMDKFNRSIRNLSVYDLQYIVSKILGVSHQKLTKSNANNSENVIFTDDELLEQTKNGHKVDIGCLSRDQLMYLLSRYGITTVTRIRRPDKSSPGRYTDEICSTKEYDADQMSRMSRNDLRSRDAVPIDDLNMDQLRRLLMDNQVYVVTNDYLAEIGTGTVVRGQHYHGSGRFG